MSENTDKVVLISTVDGSVTIKNDELHFRRTWDRKGAKIKVKKELLEELMYDQGVENMLKDGTLYIEDMEVKKELELEPEDAKEPVNVIVLNDTQKRTLLKVTPYAEFKKKVDSLPKTQVEELVQYAISTDFMEKEKTDYLKEKTQVDIVLAIRIKNEE